MVVAPTRISSLAEFGTPQFVVDKHIQAEKRKVYSHFLRACARSGLLDEALHYFSVMQNDYGLEPQLEHYTSVIDALGRCGRITDARKVIEDMPFEANDVIWTSLLSNCRMHGNVKVAEIAASSLLRLDPRDSSACILLLHIYAAAGMWDEASKIGRMMRSGGLKKEPGCSWIEVSSR